MMQKKALAILSRYLWPVDGGRKESLNHYLKELHDHYGYEITVLCFPEASQQVQESDRPYYIREIQALKEVTLVEKVYNLLRHSLSWDQWPLQCSLYYSVENEKTIHQYIEKLKPDLIFTEMIRTCTYFPAFSESNALKLANLDDLLSVRYDRQCRAENTKASFAGVYSDKLTKFAQDIISGKRIKKLVLQMESKRCAIWEKKFYQMYDYCLMTSDVERDILNAAMGQQKAKTLSVGVDVEYYAEAISVEKDPIGLSYVGNFKVAANIDTLDMIANQILPKLRCDYRFYVIGSCPEDIQKQYIGNPRIIFCGRVEDLRQYVKKAAVFLSPIAYGTGIKTKIVEAMAMGMPVVTNSVGAEGIPAEDGIHFVLRDDATALAQVTEGLLRNSAFAAELGRRAQEFVGNRFNWERVFSVYHEMGL